MLFALLLLQAAAVATPPERFSILQPVGNQPCSPGAGTARTDGNGDVVVCATDMPDQSVPLPDDYVYPIPRPSNPALTGVGALNAEGTPCAASQWGCQVGFGQPLVAAAVGAAAGLVGDALRRKPDKTGRVAIPLDDATPLPGFQVSGSGVRAGSASTSAHPQGSATP